VLVPEYMAPNGPDPRVPKSLFADPKLKGLTPSCKLKFTEPLLDEDCEADLPAGDKIKTKTDKYIDTTKL
jgi:hypothetical protein